MARVPFVVGAYVAYVVLFLILYVRRDQPWQCWLWWAGCSGCEVESSAGCFVFPLLLLTLVGQIGLAGDDGAGGYAWNNPLVVTGGVLGRMSELGRRATRELPAAVSVLSRHATMRVCGKGYPDCGGRCQSLGRPHFGRS